MRANGREASRVKLAIAEVPELVRAEGAGRTQRDLAFERGGVVLDAKGQGGGREIHKTREVEIGRDGNARSGVGLRRGLGLELGMRAQGSQEREKCREMGVNTGHGSGVMRRARKESA